MPATAGSLVEHVVRPGQCLLHCRPLNVTLRLPRQGVQQSPPAEVAQKGPWQRNLSWCLLPGTLGIPLRFEKSHATVQWSGNLMLKTRQAAHVVLISGDSAGRGVGLSAANCSIRLRSCCCSAGSSASALLLSLPCGTERSGTVGSSVWGTRLHHATPCSRCGRGVGYWRWHADL